MGLACEVTRVSGGGGVSFKGSIRGEGGSSVSGELLPSESSITS